MPKVNTQRPRIVVFTQGCDPVIVVEGKILSEELEGDELRRIHDWFPISLNILGKTAQVFQVTKLPAEQIKDTNGAGDAFVGGIFNSFIIFI